MICLHNSEYSDPGIYNTSSMLLRERIDAIDEISGKLWFIGAFEMEVSVIEFICN